MTVMMMFFLGGQHRHYRHYRHLGLLANSFNLGAYPYRNHRLLAIHLKSKILSLF